MKFKEASINAFLSLPEPRKGLRKLREGPTPASRRTSRGACGNTTVSCVVAQGLHAGEAHGGCFAWTLGTSANSFRWQQGSQQCPCSPKTADARSRAMWQAKVKGFPTKEDAARFEWRAKRQRAASSRKLVPLKAWPLLFWISALKASAPGLFQGGLHRRCQNLCDVLRAERWTKSSRPARELPLAVAALSHHGGRLLCATVQPPLDAALPR